MDRGGRGIRRSRGGRPFIRGFYRGRPRIRRPMRSRSRTSNSRDRYEYENDRSDSRERSWDSPSGTEKDISKEKYDCDDTSPIRNKWIKDDNPNEKNEERYSDKKEYNNDPKYYRRSSGHSYRGQRRPHQNAYWDRNDRGRHYSPQSQYRVRPYHSPRHRRYSRSPDRRRSPSRYRSRSRSLSRSKRYSPQKHRSPRRRSQSRRLRSPNGSDKSIEKVKNFKSNSDDENNSDDFVEKLKASKNPKTPGRMEYSEKSDDDYWIESEKNDNKKINRSDYSSKGSKTPGRSESSTKGSKTPSRQEISSKGSKTPGRQDLSSKGSKTPGRQELSSKGSKTPGRSELISTDQDDYWIKSQTSKPSTKNLYSCSWDDSPIQEKSVPNVPKTPCRKDNDDYWANSPLNEPKIDHSSKDFYPKKSLNKDSSTMYVQELSSSDSDPGKASKRTRSMSLTNSDKSDTPPLSTEQSNKSGIQYSQTSSSRGLNSILKEPPPSAIPATSNNLPIYNTQWSDMQNASSPYSSTTNYAQPQVSQFTAYQQPVPVQNSQWYQQGYQQYGIQFQQFQPYDQKSVAYNSVRPNLEPVEGYQCANPGLYNIDIKQVDITKPPPNITSITPVLDTQPKSSQDSIFEMQRETYNTKLFSLKKELETLQIQYDVFKSDNSDGRHNNELKINRKAQDDVNGKIKGVNNILEVLNTMIPKDSLKEVIKLESKKLTTDTSEYIKTSLEKLQKEDAPSNIHTHRHRSTSSSSIEVKRKRSKSVKPKKLSKTQSSDGESDSRKSYKSKELTDTNKKRKHVDKSPQFNYIYCDSCIHWCQPCNIFPKTAKEYLTHLHSESHKTTLEELNVVELPWHDTQTELPHPEKNPELPNKRVPIKGLEFFIGTNAWYCKLCDTWIGDLHCASAHFKSKRHNGLYAELIAKEPNWEIDWLTKRTRAFEKSLSETNIIKPIVTKENKTKEFVTETKVEKSFFEKEPKKEREKEKFRDRERDRDRDKYKKEFICKSTDLKNKLSPDKESIDTNNVSISDWMKPVDLQVEKSMITLKESVQKSKDKLHKNKIDEIDEFSHKSKSFSSDVHTVKKIEEIKLPPNVYEKKEDNLNCSHRNKIKLPFIGKMPFAKPIAKKTNSSTKDIPSYIVESKTDEPKDNFMDSMSVNKMLIEKMVTVANEKKVEKHFLPVDMDIDDENENNDGILSTETNLIGSQLNALQPENSMHQMYSQSSHTTLPQDLNTALNMIFPCNETSSVAPINSSVNSQATNSIIHQHFNMSYDITNNSSISPERKKKKNAPSQRKRRHLKKIMGKDESLKYEDDDDNYEDDDNDDYEKKLNTSILQGLKEESIRKLNGNESEGDELAMLGIDAEDMAAQYY